MPTGQLAPPPLRTRLVDQAGLMTRGFNTWLRGLTSALNTASTQATAPLVLTALANSLATSVLVPSAPQGVYRLSYSVRVRQAATVSSSVSVTFQWTSGGVVQTFTSPALTGNTPTSSQSGSLLAAVDGGSIIAYATTYSSTGATPMTYDLALTCESLS